MKNIKKEIVAKFRKEYLKVFPAESLSKENHYGALIPISNGLKPKTRTASLPTFWEFAEWFIRENNHKKNEHWIPPSKYCGLCQMNYDYFIKFENYGK